MAPSCHLANVTIRLPFSSSPTTQVQSPGTSIDWVDLVQFHGVTYVADWTLRGRPIQQGDLGLATNVAIANLLARTSRNRRAGAARQLVASQVGA